MIVLNWGSHYVFEDEHYIKDLQTLTSALEAEISRSNRRMPWLVIRSTSAAHQDCRLHSSPISTRKYAEMMLDLRGHERSYRWDRFENMSEIASEAWKRLGATDLWEFPLSRTRPDLHEGPRDCLHWAKKMEQCKPEWARRNGTDDSRREWHRTDMVAWWIVLLYNIIDAAT